MKLTDREGEGEREREREREGVYDCTLRKEIGNLGSHYSINGPDFAKCPTVGV